MAPVLCSHHGDELLCTGVLPCRSTSSSICKTVQYSWGAQQLLAWKSGTRNTGNIQLLLIEKCFELKS